MSCVDCELVRVLRSARTGQSVTIPRGALVHTTGPGGSSHARRRTTIIPVHVFRYDNGRVEIRWAGSGGYWRWIDGEPDAHVVDVRGRSR